MSIHVKDQSALIVREKPAPDPLQAGRVIGRGVELGVPGDSLSASRVSRLAELFYNVFDLIDDRALDLISSSES